MAAMLDVFIKGMSDGLSINPSRFYDYRHWHHSLTRPTSSLAFSRSLLPIYAALLAVALIVLSTRKQLYLLARFIYACFLKPIGHTGEQKSRLDAFYSTQASVYDATRTRLLRGREEMLRLLAGHLEQQRLSEDSSHVSEKLVWVDIGGGTGYNIEAMNHFFPIENFHAVYLIDLCEPLLEVARKRFAAKGWKNVHVLCQDASTFVLPPNENGTYIESISLCTMSYSLSMIPNFYAMLDRVEQFLNPITGLVGCVDFYVSDRTSQTVMNGGDTRRHCSWWNRTFWLHWFEWDHVCLHPSRRNYLEFRFGTIKSINGRNTFGPFASIPYYVWIGCKAKKDLSARLQIFGADPLTPAFSPTLSGNNHLALLDSIPDLSLSPKAYPFPADKPMISSSTSSLNNSPTRSSPFLRASAVEMPPESTGSPLSAFYYQKHNYRLPYIHGDDQKQFRSFIYGFTWEDPEDDMRRMGINKTDTLLCITSAGDNALHYAIAGKCKRIHCVDMNPCQGHLLELKLASIHALDWNTHWQLFGRGRHDDFRHLLDTKLAPHLSAHAYNFWKTNSSAFDKSFYSQGYSGWALRILNTIFAIRGQSSKLVAFAEASTLQEQRAIYKKHIRPVLLSGSFVRMILSNPVFLWNTLGVPMNQLAMLTSETSVRQYCIDTLDPIGLNQHVKSTNYHYYLCLTQQYNPSNPPLYLTKAGFASLKAANCRSLEAFRLHTDSLCNVVRDALAPGTLDVAITMDHADWYDPKSKSDVETYTKFIRSIRRAMPVGGRAFWRSSALQPWYADIWATEGFRVERLSARRIGTDKPIDSVNMYASLWRAIRR